MIARHYLTLSELRVVFWEQSYSRIFVFEPQDFFADLIAGFFLLIFVGKKCTEKSSRQILGKILQIDTTKIPDTVLQRGRGGPISCIHTGRVLNPPRSQPPRKFNRAIVVLGCRKSLWSRAKQRHKLKGTNGAIFAVVFLILADFADFADFLGITAFGRRRFRRKPQETAEFCRNQFVPF